jgi:polar amino acid transport system substrate-binding protein
MLRAQTSVEGVAMRNWRSWVVVALATVSIGAVAACGSSKKTTTTSTTPTTAADPAVEKLVPAAVKSKGTLTVASDASYAPNEFIASDGHTVIGMDPDLMRAIGAVMGLKVKVLNIPFGSIIPGMLAHKFDVGASSFTDTKAREKQVDFVTYLDVGESFLTKTGSGITPKTLPDLCGLTVAVESATVELDDATAQNKKCKAAGKPAIKLLVFPDQNGANLALRSGHAQVDFADSPIIAYQVKKLGVAVTQGPTFGVAPYGLALPKGNGMAPAVLAALKVLMHNGTYLAILKKWTLPGLTPNETLTAAAISNPKINGATS